MAISALFLISGVYLLFTLALWYGWRNTDSIAETRPPTLSVTVIVVVRNEEANIANLLSGFDRQSYPRALFEVIILDDHSEDCTVEHVRDFQRESSLDVKLLSLPGASKAPKKEAIEMAVAMARGSLLLVTDGDCLVKAGWVESMVNKYLASGSKFIAGPVTFVQGKTSWEKLMTIEFGSLVGAGAASFYFKTPLMCNAANMGFEKKAFEEVGGFHGNEGNASGDDVFLMRKIAQAFRGGVVFNKDNEAIVETFPEKTFRSFYYQRVRWAGKWRNVKGVFFQVVPLFVFVCHLGTLLAVAGALTGYVSLSALLLMLMVKFVGEFLFLTDVLRFLGHRIPGVLYGVASVLYPFYAILVGIAANISGYKWKNRRYD